MNDDLLLHNVRNYENLARTLTDPDDRAALYRDVYELHASLQPEATMTRWALGGAVAGAVLPFVGSMGLGAAGAAYGAYRTYYGQPAVARRRLADLLAKLERQSAPRRSASSPSAPAPSPSAPASA